MRITIIKSDQKGIKALELGRSKLVVTALLSGDLYVPSAALIGVLHPSLLY